MRVARPERRHQCCASGTSVTVKKAAAAFNVQHRCRHHHRAKQTQTSFKSVESFWNGLDELAEIEYVDRNPQFVVKSTVPASPDHQNKRAEHAFARRSQRRLKQNISQTKTTIDWNEDEIDQEDAINDAFVAHADDDDNDDEKVLSPIREITFAGPTEECSSLDQAKKKSWLCRKLTKMRRR